MEGVYRCQVTLPASLPLERGEVFSNSYHVQVKDPGTPIVMADLLDDVEDIYNLDVPTLAASISFFLSGAVSRSEEARIRVYDLGQSPPRIPVAERFFTLGNPGVATRLPTEVALVATIRAPLEAGVGVARKRGRVYYGPMAHNAAVETTAARPHADTIFTLGEALKRFLNKGLAGGTPWRYVVFSGSARDNSDQEVQYKNRPILPAIASPVSAIEVDNAWDTQRRRGIAATLRDSFS